MIQTLTSVHAKRHLRREEDGTRHERKPEPVHGHASVLLSETLALLDLKKGELVLDATAGRGGHSEAILRAAPNCLIAMDADPESVAATRERLKNFGERALVVEANFRDAAAVLKREHIKAVDKALFDLGWNMSQLASGRGFSFMHDEPLSMSYGPQPASGFTAAEILNNWSEKVLADVIFGYGEERYARPIARAIAARRDIEPIKTTHELVEIIRDAVPARARRGRINPATKTFQALRIAVNDELGSIEKGVRGAWRHLSPGGRIAVISFHSIEDRAVKNLLRALAREEGGKLITKKPLVASREEALANPSARSAKLRAIEKPIN
ncbi:MAG TPA: 16S rRNA (cytosine(1402)-N(4))-methyltransferase RsmH [Candidatus Paceibacterota bacterium]|nr:16S rRNA (cytosine(1402)-N(4))-methyltransferase RsmH [Candidatus Paceibacterota bacterium]